ncbi:hypothetical protein QN363_21010, partial [Undibacterium sp. CCC2.1]
TGLPGTTVSYPHIFKAQTSGKLSFLVTSDGIPSESSLWPLQVYADPSCSGQVQPSASVLFPAGTPLSTKAGD